MNTKYIAPTLTPFGRVSEITGIVGTNIAEDFLIINGGTVASGAQPFGDPNSVDETHCAFRFSGGSYTYLGSASEDACRLALEDWIPDGDLDGDY